jgi:hypothetical protein
MGAEQHHPAQPAPRLPEGGLAARAMEGSPCIAELFTHIHFVRLVFVFEDAPETDRETMFQEHSPPNA